MSAVLDRSPTIGVRGEATREYLNGLGFRDVEVIGCPSMFRWGDTIDVSRKVAALDAQSNVAITISPYRAAMGKIAMTAYARYPRLTYFAQDLPTLGLLFDGTPLPGGTPESLLPVHPSHPFFREQRTRFYVEPWPWIDDLRGFDFSFGTRIHGTIAALLAGTPAVVLAHDSRTLELARYFDIPHRLLRDVPPDLDPADLYAEADFTALHAGHAERFETIVQYLARNGLDHAFAHDGAAADFERRIQETDYPGSVQQWWPGADQALRSWPRDGCGGRLVGWSAASRAVDHDRAMAGASEPSSAGPADAVRRPRDSARIEMPARSDRPCLSYFRSAAPTIPRVAGAARRRHRCDDDSRLSARSWRRWRSWRRSPRRSAAAPGPSCGSRPWSACPPRTPAPRPPSGGSTAAGCRGSSASLVPTLSQGGWLELKVKDLVIDPNDPTAIARGVAGTNPSATFRAVVSCLTADGGTMNVQSAEFPATTGLRGGDAEAEVQLSLPDPCIAPILFVTSPAGAWFATTGG